MSREPSSLSQRLRQTVISARTSVVLDNNMTVSGDLCEDERGPRPISILARTSVVLDLNYEQCRLNAVVAATSARTSVVLDPLAHIVRGGPLRAAISARTSLVLDKPTLNCPCRSLCESEDGSRPAAPLPCVRRSLCESEYGFRLALILILDGTADGTADSSCAWHTVPKRSLRERAWFSTASASRRTRCVMLMFLRGRVWFSTTS